MSVAGAKAPTVDLLGVASDGEKESSNQADNSAGKSDKSVCSFSEELFPFPLAKQPVLRIANLGVIHHNQQNDYATHQNENCRSAIHLHHLHCSGTNILYNKYIPYVNKL